MDDQSLAQRYQDMMDKWYVRANRNAHVHYACSNHYSKLHYYLGIPTIVLASLVGTAVFASIENEATGGLKILAGLISFIAAILASLQTFLGFSERAERHRIISARYAAVRRRLEHLQTILPRDEGKVEREIDLIRQEIDAIAEAAPEAPANVRVRIQRDLDGGRIAERE